MRVWLEGMVRRRRLLVGAATVATAGCLGGGGGGGGGEQASIGVTSEAFDDGGSIPQVHTRDGENVSPVLSIDDVPENAAGGGTALVMTDQTTSEPTYHWVLWNLRVSRGVIPEDISRGESILTLGNANQATNYDDVVGYTGPNPPEGESHTYRFTVHALGSSIDAEGGDPAGEVASAIEGASIASGSLEGTYGGG